MSHWPCVKRAAHTVSMSHMQASQFLAAPMTIKMIETKEILEDSETVTAMAGLSMRNTQLNRYVYAMPYNICIICITRIFICRTSDRSRSVSDEPMDQDETK